jgi:hypothetical protein
MQGLHALAQHFLQHVAAPTILGTGTTATAISRKQSTMQQEDVPTFHEPLHAVLL